MNLLARLILIDAIIIGATDAIVFYHVKQYPGILTPGFVVSVIVIPITINLWY